MTKDDLGFYWAVSRISARAAENTGIVNGCLPFKDDIIKLNIDIAALEELMPLELVLGKGFTLDQGVAKRNCSEYWVFKVCKIIKGYALRKKSNTIFQQVNFTQSVLNRIAIPRYYNRIVALNTSCSAIITNTDYVTWGYSANAGVLTTGMAKANAYLALTGQAKEVSNTNNMSGVEIKAAIAVLREDVAMMDNDIFGITDSNYRGLYFLDKRTETSGIIHNKVNLHATDSVTGFGIDHVFAKNVGALKGNYTNNLGMKELHKRPGLNIIELSHINPVTKLVDYEPQTVRVTAIYHDSVDLSVEMVRIIDEEEMTSEAPEKKAAKKATKAIEGEPSVESPIAAKEAIIAKAPVAKKEVAAKTKAVVKKKK